MVALAQALRTHLASIRILPRQFLLRVPAAIRIDASLLRGIWGAALRELDPLVYKQVFKPDRLSGRNVPSSYVIRLIRSGDQLVVQWILIGDAIAHDTSLRRAWDFAAGAGFGPQRHRFPIQEMKCLDPQGHAVSEAEPWSLDHCEWPASVPIEGPCQLAFPGPLRILRKPPGIPGAGSALVLQPTLTDIVVSARRRIGAFLAKPDQSEWRKLAHDAEELSRQIQFVANWQPCGHYRPKAEDVRIGVRGTLALPEGLDELWPLLTAAQWIHIGKSTIEGLGQVVIKHLSVDENPA